MPVEGALADGPCRRYLFAGLKILNPKLGGVSGQVQFSYPEGLLKASVGVSKIRATLFRGPL